jgi:hypothetical protein
MAVETFADGEISDAVMVNVHRAATRAVTAANREADRSGYLAHTAAAAMHAAHGIATTAARLASQSAALAVADAPLAVFSGSRLLVGALPREYSGERAAQAELARDDFENPWRPRRVRPEWLTSTVVALARGIYADRAFDRMPILADALQDAGCDDDEILNHCRDAREHARGCWVVDLLLGKK